MSDSSKLRPLASHEPGIELQEEKTTTDAPSATDGVHRRWSAESIGGDDIDTQGPAQQLSLTNPMHAYHKRSNNQVSLAQLWASRTACISHTRTRAGERARALCERARAFVHTRAHICLSQGEPVGPP